MGMTIPDLRRIVDFASSVVNTSEAYVPQLYRVWFSAETIFDATYKGNVVAKERHRTNTKTGKTFTPKRTKKFEASVREWAQAHAGTTANYPVSVDITVFEQAPSKDHIFFGALGLVYADKGDVDNYAKSILDGCNKVVWTDDKLVVDLSVRRFYAAQGGFALKVKRSGLSKAEYLNMTKLWRAK